MPLAALVCVVIHIPLLIHAPLFVFTNRKGVILFGGGVCTPIQKQSGLFSTVDSFFFIQYIDLKCCIVSCFGITLENIIIYDTPPQRPKIKKMLLKRCSTDSCLERS